MPKKLPLKRIAEELARHLAQAGLTYRDWDNMAKSDRKLMIEILYRRLQVVETSLTGPRK